ncbi:IS1182 family transposase [Cecembia calidifontis]|uniref:Transposase n=1 Tax=Cecembia calidifontis TaxID=1187080 RepID=A0A4Q7P8S4_9BACT|nr:transposase [Cecembia calidifontis]RZS95086.1 transposase [Cecembia calidifontis]RZS96532.1 transposase [Cecembia calidifontis]RZS96596.1 transposase [Cecembia calidifontis]RZS98270.1 transposase [Cecembia calidifontis]
MSKVVFKNQTGNCPELFPANIFDKIPDNHPARLVDTVVNSLDISDIIKRYKGGGTSAYHPRMMIKVLFYSYLSNVYSCRKIAKALNENIHFMFISGNSTPDFRTINDFRGKILKDSIKTLFAEVVKMLVEMGYVSLDVQYIDGTKIEAKSNKYTFVWRKTVEKHKERLEGKIKSVLSDIEESILSDNQEVNQEELPKKIDSEELRERLSAINKKLKEPSKKIAKELQKLQEEHLPKLEKYEKDLEILGDRNSYSKTDHDATFMRMKEDHMKNGQLKPAYNPQISTENQFITHATIHQTAGDTTTLKSHLDSFEKSYSKQSKEIVADAGYGSEENYEMLEKKGVDAYVKYNYFHMEQKKKTKNNPFLPQNLFYNAAQDFYVCPMGQRMENVGQGKRTSSNGYVSQVTYYQAKNCEGCPLRAQCHKATGNRRIEVNHRLNFLKQQAKEKLMNKKGLEHRSKRPIEAEAAFGQLKSNNKFNRFTLTGLEKVELEFLLMAIGHNLRKMVAKSMHSGLKLSKKSSLGYKPYNSRPVFYVPKENSNQRSLVMALDFQNQKIAA